MSLPRVHLIATGGTIAGVADDPAATTRYQAGSLAGHALLESIPEAHRAASISIAQPFNLDSKDLGPGHWLQLARDVSSALADPAVDAVVVTHGTDTLEESAFLLDRLLPPGKPVVMTCAMRPASAHSADGPLNLLHALRVAASGATREAGVVAVVNERIHAASRLRKGHSHALDAFEHGDSAIGWSDPPGLDGRPEVPARMPSLLGRLDELPRVDVLWVGAGSEPDLLAASISHGARAIVLCLPGNGSLPETWSDAVHKALACHTVVVRASRTGRGRVARQPDDGGRLFAAGRLGPAQARVALMLALAGGLAPDHFFY
ncbi:MAG: asparaginase [Rhodocyclaceae bacterium]|nr:asparaginase [Rhodocyclaceae bacterium]